MKYQHLIVIFLLTMLFISDSYEHLKPAPKKVNRKKGGKSGKGGKGKKSKKNSKLTKKKKFFPKRLKNTFNKIVDLDVLIRFAFARYSSNSVAMFVTGLLQSIYLPIYRRLKQVANTKKLVKQHIKCIGSTLHPFMASQKQSIKFVNNFLRGVGASSKSFLNDKIFNYSLKRWFSSNKTVKISNKLITLRYKKLSTTQTFQKMRKILGKGVWLNVLNHAKYLIKLFRTIWFNSSFITRKVMRCAIYASTGFTAFRRYFIIKYKKTKRVICNINPVNFIVRLLRDFKLLTSLRGIFQQVAFKGIRMNKIHHVNWTRIGRSIYVSYYSLLNECPL